MRPAICIRATGFRALGIALAGAALASGCSTFSPAPYDTPAYYLDEFGMVYGLDQHGNSTLQASPGVGGLSLKRGSTPFVPFFGFYPGLDQRAGYYYVYPYVGYPSRPAPPVTVTDPVNDLPALPVASPVPPQARLPRSARPVSDLATEPRLPAGPFQRGRGETGANVPRARPRPAGPPTPRSRPTPARPARPAVPRRTAPGKPRVIDP